MRVEEKSFWIFAQNPSDPPKPNINALTPDAVTQQNTLSNIYYDSQVIGFIKTKYFNEKLKHCMFNADVDSFILSTFSYPNLISIQSQISKMWKYFYYYSSSFFLK